MRRAAIVSACGLIAGLALTACGGGSSSPRGTSTAGSDDASCTNDATATAFAAPQHYSLGTPVPFSPPDDEAQCRLRRALLTKEDLPNGLAEAGLGVAHIYGSQQVDCGMRLPAPMSAVMSQFFASNANDTLVGVSQWVYMFKPGEAAGLIGALKQRCSSLAAGGDPQGPYHAMNVPSLGDESFGVYGLKPTAAVYIRRGDLITLLMAGAKGDLAAALSQLAAKADAKLAKVGSIPTPTP